MPGLPSWVHFPGLQARQASRKDSGWMSGRDSAYVPDACGAVDMQLGMHKISIAPDIVVVPGPQAKEASKKDSDWMFGGDGAYVPSLSSAVDMKLRLHEIVNVSDFLGLVPHPARAILDSGVHHEASSHPVCDLLKKEMWMTSCMHIVSGCRGKISTATVSCSSLEICCPAFHLLSKQSGCCRPCRGLGM